MGKRKGRNAPAAGQLVTAELAPAERSVSFVGGILDTSQWAVGRVSAEIALSVDAFYACVRLISDGVSAGEWGEWRGLERLPLSRLARRPMASVTRREWTWRVVSTMAIYSVCPLRIVGGVDNEGVPWSLVPLNPARLTAIDAARYAYGSEEISADLVRFVRRSTLPVATPEMQGVISLARQELAAAAAAAAYAGSWWESGGAPLVVLSTDQDLTKDQGDEIADRWTERRAQGPSRPAVLGKGAHAESFGTDLGTGTAAAAQDRLIASIARYMGVPASYINAPSYAGSLTYSNVEQAGLDLVRYTFSAYSEPIGDLISDELPGDYIEGRRVRIDLSRLTRGEQAARYGAWESALRAGWLTKDEVRAAEGYAPQGGDAGELAAPAPEPVPVEQEVPA